MLNDARSLCSLQLMDRRRASLQDSDGFRHSSYKPGMCILFPAFLATISWTKKQADRALLWEPLDSLEMLVSGQVIKLTMGTDTAGVCFQLNKKILLKLFGFLVVVETGAQVAC